jgi:hypothetical protein
MRFLSIIKNIFTFQPSVPTPLGRWSIEKCNIKLNNRIKLSNEDHCGPCGEYTTTKKSDDSEQNKSIILYKIQ